MGEFQSNNIAFEKRFKRSSVDEYIFQFEHFEKKSLGEETKFSQQICMKLGSYVVKKNV